MQILFMDAHVLVTRCCSYPLYPWMLSLTPPALHSLHSICSGGVSDSGGALGLFRLDVCMCQQGGEFWKKWSNKGETCLIFEKLVVHRALRVHHFEREKLWFGSVCFVSGSLFPRFTSASCMTASSITSVFEESCFVSLNAFTYTFCIAFMA